MAKRETELQKRVRKFQPLWDRQQNILASLEVATTEDEKDKWRKELDVLLEEMNRGDWAKDKPPAEPQTWGDVIDAANKAAETGAREDVYPSAFAQAAQGDDRLAVALYKAAALETEVDASYTRGYEAGLLDGYTGVDANWVARFEARQADLESKLAAAQAERDTALAFYALMVNIDVLHDIAEDLANDETWEVWGELAHLREVLDGMRKQVTGGEDTVTEA